MDLQEAQSHFEELLDRVDKKVRLQFMHWTKSIMAAKLEEEESHSNTDVMLEAIQEDLRSVLPLDAILPTENITVPQIGKNAGCDPAMTVHVDGFLYSDEAVDELVERGELSRNYCTACGCRKVSPLNFISHSTSVSQLKYIFQYLLPDLRQKRLVDIGSRLGAVLYGAYYYSGCPQLIGVEINKSLCDLQQMVVDKYKLHDKIQIICDDICSKAEVLHTADVVVMNNVFEFFTDIATQQRIWQFLAASLIKPGTLLVMSPSLEESLTNLQTGINLQSWVQQVDTRTMLSQASAALFEESDDNDLDDIHLYTVIS